LHVRTDGDSVIENDSTIFESAQRDEQPLLVELSGEFDIRYLRTLESMLRDCLASGRSTLVDLSEVTFMDALCVWELAVYYQLGRGRMVLCNPSQDVGVSVAAYDLEDWVDLIYTTDLRLPSGCAAASISHNAAIKTRKASRPCISYIQR
jgi:anti-anti-sigma factor